MAITYSGYTANTTKVTGLVTQTSMAVTDLTGKRTRELSDICWSKSVMVKNIAAGTNIKKIAYLDLESTKQMDPIDANYASPTTLAATRQTYPAVQTYTADEIAGKYAIDTSTITLTGASGFKSIEFTSVTGTSPVILAMSYTSNGGTIYAGAVIVDGTPSGAEVTMLKVRRTVNDGSNWTTMNLIIPTGAIKDDCYLYVNRTKVVMITTDAAAQKHHLYRWVINAGTTSYEKHIEYFFDGYGKITDIFGTVESNEDIGIEALGCTGPTFYGYNTSGMFKLVPATTDPDTGSIQIPLFADPNIDGLSVYMKSSELESVGYVYRSSLDGTCRNEQRKKTAPIEGEMDLGYLHETSIITNATEGGA